MTACPDLPQRNPLHPPYGVVVERDGGLWIDPEEPPHGK